MEEAPFMSGGLVKGSWPFVDFSEIEKRVMSGYQQIREEARQEILQSGLIPTVLRLIGALQKHLAYQSIGNKDLHSCDEVLQRLRLLDGNLVEGLQRIESTSDIQVARKEARDLRALLEGRDT